MKYRITDTHGMTVTVENADSNVAFGIILSLVDSAIDSAYSNGSSELISVYAFDAGKHVGNIKVSADHEGVVKTFWKTMTVGYHDTIISNWLEEMERK